MKKYLIYILLIYIIIISIHYYNVCDLKAKELLTKKIIFDIIEDVEGIAISCITRSGNKLMSQNDKIDFVTRYIIENKELYNKYIVLEDDVDNFESEEINFGKIKVEDFNLIYNSLFKDESNISGEYLKLNFLPVENTSWENKEIIGVYKTGNKFIVEIKYTRKFIDRQNDFYVRYVFNLLDKIRISEIAIYDSTMN